MKKQLISKLNNAFKKTAFTLGISSMVAFTFAPAISNAQDKTPASGVSIKYVGNVNNQPVFQIEFENESGESYIVSIRDEAGVSLYNERFKDKKFSKKFQFDRTGLDNMKLTFTLTGEKQKLSQAFEVNTSVRTIEDVVVTRL